MKRNKLLTLALAACATLLAACSTELDTSANPERAGAGEALLSVALQFPATDTPVGYAANDKGNANNTTPGSYADNPVAPGVALDAEKEIRSIAFIAFTTGGASIYLSTKPVFDANGFIEPLAPVEGQPAGNYTAKFKIRSGDLTGTTTVAAVANFAEHGLTFEPQNFTIEKLRAMLTVALEADKSIEYPLLMTVAKELTLEEGNTYPVAFEMERIMARIDVLNNAYNDAAPQDRFVLTSARLLSTPTQGTMIGGEAIAKPTYVNSAVQDVVTNLAADLPAGQPAKQQLAPMYVYENSNLDPDDATRLAATATAVEVTGVYQGKGYRKVVPFVTPERVVGGVLTGGDIVSIVRNTRYVLEITAPTENDVTFTLKATDWAAGEQIDVKPDAEAPKVVGTEPGRGTTWDQETLTLDITNGEAPEFVMTVSGNRDTKYRVETEYDENPVKIADMITVEPGKLTGYADEEAGTLTRIYKIKLPQSFKPTSPYPAITKVILYNEKGKTEVNVKYAPLFTGGFIKNDEAIAIDNDRKLIDLKGLPNGSTGTVSFFASSDSEVTITPPDHKGYTNDFCTIETVDVTDKDPTYYPKYGPCKRVNVTYKAISDNPEFATISVKDASDATHKVLLSHFRKPIAYVKLPTNSNNVLAEGSHKLYLAVNNGDHGSITYTVFNKEGSTLSPSATYATNSTSPAWATGIATISPSETLSDFGVVKQTVTLALPAVIKNPAAVTAYTIGLAGETPLELIPVYPSAYNTANGTSGPITAADKAFRPVLVKGYWWSPINVGQAKISAVNDPSTAAGNLFQWGRKQALKWDSPQVPGPVDSAEAAGTNFITNSTDPFDWLKVQNNTLWNSGTAVAPKKTINDPCPAGWRVPSVTECNSVAGTQTWAPGGASASANGLLTVTGEAGTNLLFPAAGRRFNTGDVNTQGTYGSFWASAENGTNASYAYFNNTTVRASSGSRATGMPVRCVQE